MRHDSLSDLWNKNQEIVPEEFRIAYDDRKTFSIQERDLRDNLITSGQQAYWELWKYLVRPQIQDNRSKKYASSDFAQQKVQEYARRAEDWNVMLSTIFLEEGLVSDSRVVDVGSHEGDEVASLDFKFKCIEPRETLCIRGRKKYPHMDFLVGSADSIPLESAAMDAYLSLRTWCVAGVLADEALLEAKRVVKPRGLILVSLPVRYTGDAKNWDNMLEDKMAPIARWTYDLLKNVLEYVKMHGAPEDFFMYGRLK